MQMLVVHGVMIITAFVLAYLAGYGMIFCAHRFNVLDRPNTSVKKHDKPVPYLGGLAIALGIFCALAAWYPFGWEHLWWVMFGLFALLLLGLIDDLQPMRPYEKFIGQFIVVAFFLAQGFALKTGFLAAPVNMIFTALWMLTIINAFNLIDVMDGLASTIAISAALSFGAVALMTRDYHLSLLLAAFIGGLLGFLMHNKPNARIYMGDAGALFIGGFLSIIPLMHSWSEKTPYGFFVPFIILALPLIEVTTLIVVRSLKGIPFYNGSPHHFSLYLQRKGMSRYSILAFSLCASFFASSVGLLLFGGYISLGWVGFTAALFLVFWVWFVLGEEYKQKQ
jgi:UDP-GlcNAc:undecaprenyl-phosphate GlcNAc-1-phosphate transferase